MDGVEDKGMSGLVAQEQVRSLEGAEKVAALLLALDRDVSQRVLKYFDPEELRRVARLASGLGAIPAVALESLYSDLLDEISNGDLDLIGDAGRTEDLLSGVVGDEQVADIMSDVRGSSNQFFWRRVTSIPEKTLVDYLRNEHPQVVAVVVSKLEATYAAKALAQMPGPRRANVMRRMLVSKPVADPVLRVIEMGLQEDLFAASSAPSASEVNTRVAGIINQLERDQIDEILASISEAEPLIAAQLKSLLFSFEDIVTLNQRARTILFDQLPTDRLILALRGTEPALREAVLPCLSARVRRMVEAELATPDLPPRREIVAAQRQIAETVLRLADQGVIEINSGDGAADQAD